MKQLYVVTNRSEKVAVCPSREKSYWVALQDIGVHKIASMVDLAIAEGRLQETMEDFLDALFEEYNIEIEAVDFIDEND